MRETERVWRVKGLNTVMWFNVIYFMLHTEIWDRERDREKEQERERELKNIHI